MNRKEFLKSLLKVTGVAIVAPKALKELDIVPLEKPAGDMYINLPDTPYDFAERIEFRTSDNRLIGRMAKYNNTLLKL